MLNDDSSKLIVTTEKDSVKFLAKGDIAQIIKERLYYTPIRMRFIDGDITELLERVERLCTKDKIDSYGYCSQVR